MSSPSYLSNNIVLIYTVLVVSLGSTWIALVSYTELKAPNVYTWLQSGDKSWGIIAFLISTILEAS